MFALASHRSFGYERHYVVRVALVVEVVVMVVVLCCDRNFVRLGTVRGDGFVRHKVSK